MDNQFSQYRIVADSSADLFSLKAVPFSSVPLKVVTAEKEYLDVEGLDVAQMVEELKLYKGKSGSSCPNAQEWLNAFGDAKYIFGVTLTSGLSGSYNAAQIARQLYEEEYPDRHVFLVDSLSAGPGEALLVEKLEELILEGLCYADICQQIKEYQEKTGLIFILESLTNFANNGRVSPAVAKIAGLLGISIVGKASSQGTLEPTDKCRGLKKSIDTVIKHLTSQGFRHGKIRIAHCFNESGANSLKSRILERFQNADIKIYSTNGLCSFYAEKGGLLVGYEIL